jgi:Ser/Thr protein kinase RdoA (MazF antagonist)
MPSRSIFERMLARYLGLLRPAEQAGASSTQFESARIALERWDVPHVSRLTNLGGRASSNFAFHSSGRNLVLRYYTGPLEYLRYQMRVVQHLARSNFPYKVPRILPASDGSDYVYDGRGFWIVYEFLPGRPVTDLFELFRAQEVGLLVAHFHSAMADFSLGSEEGDFALPIFERQRAIRALTTTSQSRLSKKHQDRLAIVLESYIKIPEQEITAVNQLPKRTIYNDWHGWNMLQTDGSVTGLIDFDSLVEAPHVTDIQNALGFILLSTSTPNLELAGAFLERYSQKHSVEVEQVRLIDSIMIDRMLDVISYIQREKSVDTGRIELVGRMVDFLYWIVSEGELSSWLGSQAAQFRR